MQFLEKLKPLGLLVLRVALGASFVLNGYPKLSTNAQALNALSISGFPNYFSYIFATLEVFGGGLLIAGLFTRGAALLLAIEVGLVLSRTSKLSFEISAFRQLEVPLLLGAMALAIVTTGAGSISIDAFTFESTRKSGKKSKAKD